MYVSVGDGLGQDFSSIAPIISAAITATGGITSSFITADANKYAAKQQANAQILVGLAQEKAQLEAVKAQALTNTVQAQEGTQQTVAVTQAVSGTLSNPIAAVTILAIVGIAAYVALKE